MALRHRLLAPAALALAFVASGANPGLALDQCKIRSYGRDGTLLVDAKNVNGTLTWGFTAQRALGTFDNAAECISNGRASKCTLAPENTLERVSPPPSCTIHLADASGTCSATLKRCTPGLRPVCPPDMERVGSKCIEKTSSSGEHAQAISACHARGRSLCTTATYMECDVLNLSNSRTLSCGWNTDNGNWLFANGTNAEAGQNVFNRLFIYRSDNVVHEQDAGSGGIYSFHCCGELGSE